MARDIQETSRNPLDGPIGMPDDRSRQAIRLRTEVSLLVVSNRRGFFAGVVASVVFAYDSASGVASAVWTVPKVMG